MIYTNIKHITEILWSRMKLQIQLSISKGGGGRESKKCLTKMSGKKRIKTFPQKYIELDFQ